MKRVKTEATKDNPSRNAELQDGQYVRFNFD